MRIDELKILLSYPIKGIGGILEDVYVQGDVGYNKIKGKFAIDATEENIERLKDLCEVGKNCEIERVSEIERVDDIVRVDEIVQNKVVEVEFSDGDIQKSVCREPDIFSMDMAIAICLCKHLVGGTKKFNNIVKRGIKVYNFCVEKKKRQQEEREAEKRRREKKIERKLKRKAAAREAQIEIQKEAYLRAMKEKELEQATAI